MIKGVDLSNVNGRTDIGSLRRQHDLSFVFFKATEGTGFRDGLFPAAWKVLGELGIARGSYHFAHPDNDPAAEARFFLAAVETAGLRDTDMLALDLEISRGMSPAHVAAYGRKWCSDVRAATGREPLVYTFLSFAETGNCAGLGGYPLWIADPSSPPGRPRVPGPWKTWALHQYGQQGVDLDLADYPDATAMTRAHGKHPAPHPAPAPKTWRTEGLLTLAALCAQHLHEPVSEVLTRTVQASPVRALAAPLAAHVNAVFAGGAYRCPSGAVWYYPTAKGPEPWTAKGMLSLSALASDLGTSPAAMIALTIQHSGLKPLGSGYINAVFASSPIHVPAGCVLHY